MLALSILALLLLAVTMGLALAHCHAIYWVVTHPVNKAWLADIRLASASRVFFSLFSSREANWEHMRKVWEWSHVARACLATFGFLALAMAVTRP